tara:strand:+ start:328 stop:447 length:120 start_codon:yes stop_codon:yes gene_type:complete
MPGGRGTYGSQVGRPSKSKNGNKKKNGPKIKVVDKKKKR